VTRTILRAALICLLLAGSLPAHAEDAAVLLDQRMARLTEELQLNPDQAERVRILQAEQMRLVSMLLAEAQADGSRRAMLGAAREIRTVRDGIEMSMQSVLSPPQMEAYRLILAEQEAIARERFAGQ
jgi:hypothetical protein